MDKKLITYAQGTHMYMHNYTHTYENIHIEKELKNNHEKDKKPIEKWTKDTKTQFTEKEMQMSHKYIIGYFTSVIMREIQIKTLRNLFFNLPDLQELKSLVNTLSW